MMTTPDSQAFPRLTRSVDRLFRTLEEKGPEAGAPPSDGGSSRTPEGAASGAAEAVETADPAQAPGPVATAAAPEAPMAPPSPWRAPTGGILGRTVDEYLEVEGGRRDELSRRIRERAETLRHAGDVNSLADAVESLAARGAAAGGDEAPLSLARYLAAPPVVQRLVERLGEAREEQHRHRLLTVVISLKEETANAVVQALRETDDRTARRNYVEALAGMGRQGMAMAVRMIRDTRWFVVRNGVVILGEIASPAVTDHLLRTRNHEDPRVRRESLLALAKVESDDRAAAAIFEALDDPDVDVRTAAARGAGLLGTVRAVQPLVDRLEREDEPDVQISILRALGSLRDPTAVPALAKKAEGRLFSRPPSAVRAAAYRALGAIGTPRAREILQAGSKDRDEEVRSAARRALVVRE